MLTEDQLVNALEELFTFDNTYVHDEECARQILEAAKPPGIPVLYGRESDGRWFVRLYRLGGGASSGQTAGK